MTLKEGIKHIETIAKKILKDYDRTTGDSDKLSPLIFKETVYIENEFKAGNRSKFRKECVNEFHFDANIPIEFMGSRIKDSDDTMVEIFIFHLEVKD